MVTSVLSFKPRRLPSHLSGLVAERARADGHIGRLQLLIDDLQAELQAALTTRESCDVLIAKAFAASPEIDPVAAWRGRYGKRGAIRDELIAHLADAYPEAKTSKELAVHLCQVLGIDFPSQAAASQWIKTNVNGSLTRLRKRGLVEALHDTSPVGRDGNAYGAWRWCPEGAKPTSVSELASLAARAGIEVGQASMKTELEPEDEPTAEDGDEEGAFIPSRPRRNKSTRRRTRNAA